MGSGMTDPTQAPRTGEVEAGRAVADALLAELDRINRDFLRSPVGGGAAPHLGASAFAGLRVIESPHLMEEIGRIVTRRPFWRRLLSGRLHDIATETVPSRDALQLPDGTLVMHPAMVGELRALTPAGER